MDRSWLLYGVDIILGLSFLVVMVTGLMKFPGLLPAIGIRYQSVPFVALSKTHDWAGIGMTVAAGTHLVLHWRWIVSMTKRLFVKKVETPTSAPAS